MNISLYINVYENKDNVLDKEVYWLCVKDIF